MDRVHVEDRWDEAVERIGDLEKDVRSKNRRMDMMSYAFKIAFGRWQDRVFRHPEEDDQTRYTMSRELMIHIGDQEYDDAMRRGML